MGLFFIKRKNASSKIGNLSAIGDYIRVIGRSGDYYIKENGERVYFTDAGIYVVKESNKRRAVGYRARTKGSRIRIPVHGQ